MTGVISQEIFPGKHFLSYVSLYNQGVKVWRISCACVYSSCVHLSAVTLEKETLFAIYLGANLLIVNLDSVNFQIPLCDWGHISLAFFGQVFHSKKNENFICRQLIILFFKMIFIFSIIVGLQCSVNLLLYSKVTQSHIHTCILFLTLSSIMLHHKCIDTVHSAIQQDLIAYPLQLVIFMIQVAWSVSVLCITCVSLSMYLHVCSRNFPTGSMGNQEAWFTKM